MPFSSGINSIDALVGASWSSQPGSAAALSFSFFGTQLPAGLPERDARGYRPMDPAQQQAVREALAAWAAVAAVTFVELPQGQRADIGFGTNDQGHASSGYADLPGSTPDGKVALFMNNAAMSSSRFDPGSFGFAVLMHEIGHALGLKHPGPYDSAGGTAPGPYLPSAQDSRAYTQMSYYDGPEFFLTLVRPVTPMLYDIQAIQFLYGPNLSYRPGDDVYRFDASSLPQCVWDAGGHNTFDFSGSSRAADIDLHEGAFSSSFPGARNISIAFGVTVAAAVGSDFDDTITCNGAGNSVAGRAGDDRFVPGAGADALDGGAGTDWAQYGAARASHLVQAGPGFFSVAPEGGVADRLVGVERLQFADVVLAIDIDGVAGTCYRLYQAAFGRLPDLAGLSFWIARGDAGLAPAAMAGAFAQSAEFAALYGAPDDRAFVVQLYQNVLHRAPDAAGLQFFLDHLQGGAASREQALLAFSESAENRAALVGQMAQGIEYLPGG